MMNNTKVDIQASRFSGAQSNRTLKHPLLPQPTENDEIQHVNRIANIKDSKDSFAEVFCRPCTPSPQSDEPADLIEEHEHASHTEIDCHSEQHTFVVCADSQLGMTSLNKEWETELHYCRLAVDKINSIKPRPKFVCVCGDLVDMENSFYYNNPNALKSYELEECEEIQRKQFYDFKDTFGKLHPDIAIVCLCGNHDIGTLYLHMIRLISIRNLSFFNFFSLANVSSQITLAGNRPTQASIQKFRNEFGDEYLAFWANGTYNIVLNNVLFTNPDGAEQMFIEQLHWLEERLEYANDHQAAQIFVFSHHPWFLYHEEEDHDDFVPGAGSSFPREWDDGSGKFDGAIFPDEYFSVPKKYRKMAMDLFKDYNVNACFSGHFHQNLVSKASFGMDMIITGPLSMVFDSNGKPNQTEGNGRGVRVIEVSVDTKNQAVGAGKFTHHFESIE